MQTNEKKQIGKEIISTTNVTKSFGRFQALKGITAKVYEQEVVVVLGPSGSGKSTFIRTLNRLEPHDSGTIIVDGIEGEAVLVLGSGGVGINVESGERDEGGSLMIWFGIGGFIIIAVIGSIAFVILRNRDEDDYLDDAEEEIEKEITENWTPLANIYLSASMS